MNGKSVFGCVLLDAMFFIILNQLNWNYFYLIWCHFILHCAALPISSLFPFIYFMVSLTIKMGTVTILLSDLVTLLEVVSVHVYLLWVLQVQFQFLIMYLWLQLKNEEKCTPPSIYNLKTIMSHYSKGFSSVHLVPFIPVPCQP